MNPERDATRRESAARVAVALAEALRRGNLELARTLLLELGSDCDRLGIGPGS